MSSGTLTVRGYRHLLSIVAWCSSLVFQEDWLAIRFAGFNQETKNHRQGENQQNTPLHVDFRQKNRLQDVGLTKEGTRMNLQTFQQSH